MEALKLWRLFPTQIRGGLSLYHHRSIGEWHRGEMSSGELLDLLDELPEDSKFKEAAERTFWVVEYQGDDADLKGKLLQIAAIGRKPPSDTKLVATYVDWTYDRKLAARTVRELIALRGGGDFSNLTEPVEAIMADRQARKDAARVDLGRSQIHSGLYGYEKGGT